MSIDRLPNPETEPFLFAVGTNLAYRIARRYYHNEQFVWVCPFFNKPIIQPGTSNPHEVARRWILNAADGDHGNPRINEVRVGILTGAKEKYEKGIISQEQREIINRTVNDAEFKDLFPIIYIIGTKKVYDRIIETTEEEKANHDSAEWKIVDLKDGEFKIIDFSSLLNNILEPKDERLGDLEKLE